MLAIKFQSMGNALESGFCWSLENKSGFAKRFRTQVKSTEAIYVFHLTDLTGKQALGGNHKNHKYYL